MIEKIEKEIMKNWKGDIKTPIVSICTITYNHESYIEEALDSFLMQNTDFPFEIIIDDDCSSDKTADIIKEYKKKFPNIININLRKKNIGMVKNWTKNIQRGKGKYLALCEGDDYWLVSNKLQLQVDFLENNLNYSMCCCSCENYDETNKILKGIFPNIKKEQNFNLKDLFQNNICKTATVMYRNTKIEFPKNYSIFTLADWPLHMIYADKGKIKYIPNVVARYRIHENGVWTQSSAIKKIDGIVYMLQEMNKYFKNKYYKETNDSIGNLFKEKTNIYLSLHLYEDAIKSFEKVKKSRNITFYDKLIFKLGINFPKSWKYLKKVKHIIKGT